MSEDGPPDALAARAEPLPPDASAVRREILLAARAGSDAELKALDVAAAATGRARAPDGGLDLRGLTQLAALRILALRAGGRLVSRDAARYFRAGGLTRGSPSAVVHALLHHNDRAFVREEKGRYRLASPAASAALLLRPKWLPF